MEYDNPAKRLFAAWYDLLNRGVETRVSPYRRLTAGISVGRTLEIGGGTGANLPYYPPGSDLYAIEPNPHMARRFADSAKRYGRRATIIPAVGEALPFADASFDSAVVTLTL